VQFGASHVDSAFHATSRRSSSLTHHAEFYCAGRGIFVEDRLRVRQRRNTHHREHAPVCRADFGRYRGVRVIEFVSAPAQDASGRLAAPAGRDDRIQIAAYVSLAA